MPSLSKCCGVEVLVATADEGTSFYLCGECRQACDAVPVAVRSRITTKVSFPKGFGKMSDGKTFGQPSFDPIEFAEWVKEEQEKEIERKKSPDASYHANYNDGAVDAYDAILSYLASHGITTKE